MNRFIRALETKYQSKVEECLATLDLYLNKSVGVGEHPDIFAVIDQYVAELDTYKSRLATLKELFTIPENTNTENPNG
jgi:uncharacterized protein (DUF342 family)